MTDCEKMIHEMQTNARAANLWPGEVFEVHVMDGVAGEGQRRSIDDFLSDWGEMLPRCVPEQGYGYRQFLGVVHDLGASLFSVARV